MPQIQFPRWYLLSTLLLLLLAMSACAGLAGEPEVVATIATAPPLPTEVGYPVEDPNLANGARIYAQNCTDCHGINGNGQGELVQSGQVNAMASLLDYEHVRGYRPDEYFDIITNGNLANLMPPWREALTERERWDVALYVYTLAYTPEQIDLGASIYATHCIRCHGENGRGDGEDMIETGRRAFNYHDWDTMSILADEAMYYSIAEGIGESMPAFSPELSDQEINAVIAYTRTLAMTNFAQSRDDTNETSSSENLVDTQDNPSAQADDAQADDAQLETFSFTGTVSNGTLGGRVPAEAQVFLRFGNFADGISVLETTLDNNNGFAFNDVPLNDDYDYVAVMLYEGINFPSEFFTGSVIDNNVSADITVYERTEDPFSISISAIDINIDTFTVDDLGTGLVFEQLMTYQNNSDRVYRTDRAAGDGRFASLLVQLPPGAIILNESANPRYLIAREQFALIDTAPVFPGEHTLEAIYFLPYDGGAIIDTPVNNPLEGQVNITLVPAVLQIVDEQLPEVGLNADGNRNYQGSLQINAGDSLTYELRGDLFSRTEADIAVVNSNRLTEIVLAGLAIIGTIVAIMFWRNRSNDDAKINELVRQIAELDTMHQQGQINHDAYQQERQQLKEKLGTYLQQRSESDT